ncbi:hypothetical protein MUY27_02955 [Mucilaginibacter sp. RS28]|uniref:Uncharacterized protein n=1 Tax=Mucilaginibacter straminoryzae TaxID=2932774 RepID=A0A9X2B8F0_9SPHI|nr:hypothetical protein [Mucilaginibacter straminoryzae]MCJ8208650.1 hypothetical protein [Mucilaginibacter straminoryzae]
MRNANSYSIEEQQIRGITVRNIIVTIISTVSIVVSVMTTYFQLKEAIYDIKSTQENQTRINDLRLKVLENQVNVLQKEIDKLELKKDERLAVNR